MPKTLKTFPAHTAGVMETYTDGPAADEKNKINYTLM